MEFFVDKLMIERMAIFFLLEAGVADSKVFALVTAKHLK
jgi:hypothetical protein